jgi:Skp family chaperone for outer membrane proteins
MSGWSLALAIVGITTAVGASAAAIGVALAHLRTSYDETSSKLRDEVATQHKELEDLLKQRIDAEAAKAADERRAHDRETRALIEAQAEAIAIMKRECHQEILEAVSDTRRQVREDCDREVAALREQMTAMDRHQTDRLNTAVSALAEGVKAGAATGLRIEAAAQGVASDLADSHQRADDVESNQPGAAADAAATSEPPR